MIVYILYVSVFIASVGCQATCPTVDANKQSPIDIQDFKG